MCFCTDIAAQSKFDAGRILLKSGDDGGRWGDAKEMGMLVAKIEEILINPGRKAIWTRLML